jgi:hypothetical protein
MFDKTSTFVCVVLGATLVSLPASAQSVTEPEVASSSPGGPAGDASVTLPKGRALLDAYLGFNLVSGAEAKPISLSPDVWYGVTDDLTVGLVHSAVGGSGFMGFVGTSLCLTGTDNGCAKLYDNFGVDARYKLKTGNLAYAADGGLYVLSFDPDFRLAVKLGLVARWQQDKIAVEVSPNLFIGATGRTIGEGATEVTVNGETLNLPITGLYAVTPKISAALQLGAVVPFENTGDTYRIPLSIGGFFQVNESINVNLAFSLLAVAGGGSATGFDNRTLTLGGTYAF